MKKCTKCKISKDESEFNFKNKSKNRKCSMCRDCFSNYNSVRYDTKREMIDLANKLIYIRNAEYLVKHLENNPCIDCGEDDPIVLEFDHINNKTASVTKLAKNKISLENLQKEIDKCVVRCANCHRRKTAKERSYYRHLRGVV